MTEERDSRKTQMGLGAQSAPDASDRTANLRGAAAPEPSASVPEAGVVSPEQLVDRLVDDRYLVTKRVGRGGMGWVFRVRDQAMRADIALKMLKPDLAVDELEVKRFEREARIMAGLGSPFVVRAMNMGTWQLSPGRRVPYYTMEIIDGENLHEYIWRSKGLPKPEMERLFEQLVRGVAHAHERGIVHRDLKPGNIKLQQDAGDGQRTVKILDFGVATSADETEELTQEGKALGTPSYLPPEAFRAGYKAAPTTDVYALGVIAYEMVIGRPLWHGTADVLLAQRHAGALPDRLDTFPEAVRAKIAPEFADILETTVCNAPQERLQTAGDLLVALRQLRLPKPIAVGTILKDRYRLMREIGAGGMGVVYEVVDQSNGQRRALKMHAASPEFEDAALAEAYLRFDREAGILMRVKHPAVIRILDKDRPPDGQPYYVMEFVEGRTLGDLIDDDGPGVWTLAVDALRQVASALDMLHRLEPPVFHRDVKPDNVVLDDSGQAKLIDFGIARVEGSQLTDRDVAVGTPGFRAPEQLDPDQQVTGKTDQWCVGAIVYWLLTGILPGEGPDDEPDDAQTDANVLEGNVLPLMALRPDAPAALERALTRALAVKPADRFDTVTHFVEAIAKAGGTGIKLAPPVEELSATPVERPAPATTAKVTPKPNAVPWFVAAMALAGAGALAVWQFSGERGGDVAPMRERPVAVAPTDAGAPRAPSAPGAGEGLVDAAPATTTKVVVVTTQRRGKARTGIELLVTASIDGRVETRRVVTPVELPVDVGTRVDAEVIDRRYAGTTTRCTTQDDSACVIDLRSKAKTKTPRTRAAPAPDTPAKERGSATMPPGERDIEVREVDPK